MEIRDTRIMAYQHRTSEAKTGTPDSPEVFSPEGASGRIDLQDLYVATRKEALSLESKLPDHFPGEVLVKTKAGFSLEGLSDLAKDYGASVERKFDLPSNIYQSFDGELMLLKLPKGMSTADAMAMMGKDDRVQYVAANEKLYALDQDQKFPEDLNDELWGMHNTGQMGGYDDVDIDAPQAWRRGDTGSKNAPVMMVLDTGIDYNHKTLRDNIWVNPGEIPGNGIDDDGNGVIDDVHGFDAITKSGDPMDEHGHGTHCTGTIAGNGTDGVYGVNHQGNIMGIRFLDARGAGSSADAIEGILYAEKMGVKLASHSWGGGGFNPALYDVLKNSKALHIAASGNERNDNDKKLSYPASYDLDNVVSVAATNHRDKLATFSNWGTTTVDLAAPGVNIMSTVLDDGYSNYSGTSMATPHVSGVAYAIMQKFPEASIEEIKARLFYSVDKVEGLKDKMVTGGRLNMYSALEVDEIAPGRARELDVSALGSRKVGVSFLASGDDEFAGSGVHYEVRYSDKPIVFEDPKEGEISWKEALVGATGYTKEAGERVATEIEIPVSDQDRKLHYAVVQIDNVGNLSAIEGQEVKVPKASVPLSINFKDGVQGFELEGDWGIKEFDGRQVLSDTPPHSKYKNDMNASAISPVLDLRELKDAELMFSAKYDLELRYDHLHVEASRLNEKGEPGEWVQLSQFTGEKDWSQYRLDLRDFEGEKMKLRFRLETDESDQRKGFMMDQIMIVADPAS